MNVSINQVEISLNAMGDLRTLTKDDILAQTKFVNNNEDESWMDNNLNEDFNPYIEEYE